MKVDIELTITNNFYECGGYAIFANFSQNGNSSCEEQIIKDASTGFSKGSRNDYTLENCSKFFNSSYIKKGKFVELSGWSDLNVSLNSI